MFYVSFVFPKELKLILQPDMKIYICNDIVKYITKSIFHLKYIAYKYFKV